VFPGHRQRKNPVKKKCLPHGFQLQNELLPESIIDLFNVSAVNAMPENSIFFIEFIVKLFQHKFLLNNQKGDN